MKNYVLRWEQLPALGKYLLSKIYAPVSHQTTCEMWTDTGLSELPLMLFLLWNLEKWNVGECIENGKSEPQK